MAQAAENAKDLAFQQKTEEAANVNKSRSGKGTRIKVGATRGRNPQLISFEAFDESLPETLPETLQEFMDLTGVKDEKPLVSFLIDGFNGSQYTNASDPIAEYVNQAWPEDLQRQFKMIVRNYVNATAALGTTVEQAVDVVKPNIEKAFQAMAAAGAAK